MGPELAARVRRSARTPSHARTVLSPEPLTIHCPSGLMAAERTLAVCPVSVRTGFEEEALPRRLGARNASTLGLAVISELRCAACSFGRGKC